MIDWSYGLLSERERVLFERLAVFVGGWTLDAAETIASDGEVEAGSVLDLLERLLDKSLIERQPDSGVSEARYRMLETIREYARARLTSGDELPAVTRRHRDYFAALAHEAVSHLRSSDEGVWTSRLRADLDNLRAAIEAGLADQDESELVTRFGGDTARLWFGLDLYSEGRVYCRRFLSRPDPAGEFSLTRFHLNVAGGFLAVQQGDRKDGAELFAEGLRIAEARNEESLLQVAYSYLGNLAFAEGRCAEAQHHHERALAIARELKDARRISIALSNLANNLELQGDHTGARSCHEESLEWARQAGDTRSAAYTLAMLGESVLLEGRFDEALRFFEESLETRRQLGDRWGMAAASSGIAAVLSRVERGEYERAEVLYDEAIAIFQELGDQLSLARTTGRRAEMWIACDDFERAREDAERALCVSVKADHRRDVATNLVLVAMIRNEMGQPDRSCPLLAAAERILSELEEMAPAGVRTTLDEQKGLVVRALGHEVSSRLFEQGRSMDEAALLAEALRP